MFHSFFYSIGILQFNLGELSFEASPFLLNLFEIGKGFKIDRQIGSVIVAPFSLRKLHLETVWNGNKEKSSSLFFPGTCSVADSWQWLHIV